MHVRRTASTWSPKPRRVLPPISRTLDNLVVDKTGLTADGASVSGELQKQLGLRPVPGKVPAVYLIIDHIEKLTAN